MKPEKSVEAEQLVGWREAMNFARATVGKPPLEKEPSEKMVLSLLDGEHSPIRVVTYRITMRDIPYWVSVHLVRHKVGVEHFVSTQRTDRTGTPREKLPQDNPVTHTMVLNAQAILNISHRRLCACASKETREVWRKVVSAVKMIDPLLASLCRPMCEYRGGKCHEHLAPCGRCPEESL